jgi:C-terminal processing protease CtpA/Prc
MTEPHESSIITKPHNAESEDNIERQECINFVNTIKNHFIENFPFLSDEARDTFCEKFDKLLEDEIINLDELIKQLRQIIVTLDNSHVGLSELNIENFEMEKKLYYKAGTFWIDVEGEPMEIVTIDNTPIDVLVEEKIKEVGGGTLEWKRYKALNNIMSSRKESGVAVIAHNADGETVEVDTRFVKKEKRFSTEAKKEDYVEGRMLSDEIGYISINSWSNQINIDGKNIAELVEEELEKMKDCPSLIFDVRENDGGDSRFVSKIARHFIKEKTKCCSFLRKNPDQKEMVASDAFVGPEGEFYEKKLVILTGPKCISSTDMFLTFLKDTGRAISIGQTTGGGSGNPQSIKLNIGGREFELRVSCWRNYRNNGQEIENNGIEPDIYVQPTLADVVAHRDVELERAVEYLEEN